MTTTRAARPTLVALALGAMLLAAGCGTAGSPGGVPGRSGDGASTAVADGTRAPTSGSDQTMSVGDVRLTASASIGLPTQTVDSGVRRMPGLVVEYTLTNTGPTDLVAYDVVPDDLGSATLPADVDPEHAWVYLEQGQVHVSKQSFDPAPGVTFFAVPTTGARALPAGGRLTGRAYVPTPFMLDVPGEQFAAPRAPIPSDVTAFRFCVQVGERAPQLKPSRVAADVLEAPVAAPTGDELGCTEPLRVPVA